MSLTQCSDSRVSHFVSHSLSLGYVRSWRLPHEKYAHSHGLSFPFDANVHFLYEYYTDTQKVVNVSHSDTHSNVAISSIARRSNTRKKKTDEECILHIFVIKRDICYDDDDKTATATTITEKSFAFCIRTSTCFGSFWLQNSLLFNDHLCYQHPSVLSCRFAFHLLLLAQNRKLLHAAIARIISSKQYSRWCWTVDW